MRILDAYDRRARLAVAYLVFSPVVVLVVCLSLGTKEWWSKLGGVVAACGAPLLAAQWGRSGGKRKEPWLFARWGGMPTINLLRFRSGAIAEVVERRHKTVERGTGIKLPTAAEEQSDPAGADAAYGNAIDTMRELTRRREEFPLVFEEVTNYGFRRNLWGRKPFGTSVAILALAVGVGFLVAALLGHGRSQLVPAIVTSVYAGVALSGWLLMVTPDWVKEVADAYAQRLVESAVRLPPRRVTLPDGDDTE